MYTLLRRSTRLNGLFTANLVTACCFFSALDQPHHRSLLQTTMKMLRHRNGFRLSREVRPPPKQWVYCTPEGMVEYPRAPRVRGEKQNAGASGSVRADDPANPLADMNHTDFGTFMNSEPAAKRARGNTNGTVSR